MPAKANIIKRGMQEAEEFRRLADDRNGFRCITPASLAATQIEWTKAATNELANYSDPASPGRPSD